MIDGREMTDVSLEFGRPAAISALVVAPGLDAGSLRDGLVRALQPVMARAAVSPGWESVSARREHARHRRSG